MLLAHALRLGTTMRATVADNTKQVNTCVETTRYYQKISSYTSARSL